MSEMGEAKYYDNPDLWERERYMENKDELRRMAACAELIPDEARSILDVGAGNGAFLRFLEDRKVSIKLAGLERSETAITRSLSRAQIQLGSIDDLPFEDRSFDVVSCMEVFEHLPYGVYEKALREVERVAKDYILVSVPYKEARVRVQCPYCSCTFDPSYHMRSFNEAILSDLFGSFRSVSFVRVVAEAYVWGSNLRRVYQSVTKNDTELTPFFPPTALCPQCSFSGAGAFRASSPTKPKTSGVLRLVKSVLPKQQAERWVVALYERKR